MKKIQFKCTLLSDVVLSAKAASEGNQSTLDFIPGNSFLGIVASQLYKKETYQESFDIFHSGKVKFGDAHCAKNGIRSVKIPLAFYYPKLKKMEDECYVAHKVKNLSSDEMIHKQLKQCRFGFYCFSYEKILKTSLPKTFAIKSAYDKHYRRSYDEKMYGYESLNQGAEFYFDVTFDDVITDTVQSNVKKALEGVHRIGRSKTAQYGLVKIETCTFDCYSSNLPKFVKPGELIEVYADGRLIFMDQYGVLTFQPSAEDLGIPGGEIRWDLSQVRTFQYSPWNFKRQAYDADRCGIEKGSVFIVEATKETPLGHSDFVGFYQNEGFGKIIYNPDFLKANSDGTIMYKFPDKDNPIPFYEEKTVLISQENNDSIPPEGSPNIIVYLHKRKKQEQQKYKIYKAVNLFVDENKGCFKGTSFASQWGEIRSIALRSINDDEVIDNIRIYISHGIKEKDWNVKKRKELLLDFLETHSGGGMNMKELVINLASEMAKTCK